MACLIWLSLRFEHHFESWPKDMTWITSQMVWLLKFGPFRLVICS